jgi:hypothetical protein
MRSSNSFGDQPAAVHRDHRSDDVAPGARSTRTRAALDHEEIIPGALRGRADPSRRPTRRRDQRAGTTLKMMANGRTLVERLKTAGDYVSRRIGFAATRARSPEARNDACQPERRSIATNDVAQRWDPSQAQDDGGVLSAEPAGRTRFGRFLALVANSAAPARQVAVSVSTLRTPGPSCPGPIGPEIAGTWRSVPNMSIASRTYG